MLAVRMNKPMIKNSCLMATLCILVVCSCNQAGNSDKHTSIKQNKSTQKLRTKIQDLADTPVIEQKDAGQQWLKSLFKCKNGNKYCFYLATEEEVCTKRFYQFMIDSEELFGASNLSEEEYPNAIKKYKEKRGKIYPLRKETEPWLFGRGQDDMENINDVNVSKISDLNYLVTVNFGEEIKTKSKVKLIKKDKDFKIDYCETIFL